jgi:DNA-binding NarL/FixJ family response regulator
LRVGSGIICAFNESNEEEMNAPVFAEYRACVEALFLARADEYAQNRFNIRFCVEGLSIREMTILRMLDKGLTAEEIAAVIGCSVSTVRTHTRNIYSKLGVGSSIQAVSLGRRMGLITDNQPKILTDTQ